MDKTDFEGSLVLEKLAEVNKVEEFFAAVDADDFLTATYLMKTANLDAETIAEVIRQMAGED